MNPKSNQEIIKNSTLLNILEKRLLLEDPQIIPPDTVDKIVQIVQRYEAGAVERSLAYAQQVKIAFENYRQNIKNTVSIEDDRKETLLILSYKLETAIINRITESLTPIES